MSVHTAFSNSAKSGKALLAKCSKCDHLQLGTATFCSKCGSRKFTSEEKPAKGKVATYTIITVPPDGFEKYTPYAWVVMTIADTDLRVSGFMAGIATPKDLAVGDSVKVTGFDERGIILERD